MTVEPSFDTSAYRNLVGRFATGVTVVTVNDGGEYRAMTANSFTSVSLDPLLILISVTRDASMHDPIHEAGNFAVNILAADQRPAAELFARRGELTEPMGGIPFHVGGTGAPLLDGGLGWLECEVWRVDVGATPFSWGAVTWNASPDGEPLLFAGRYQRLTGRPSRPSGVSHTDVQARPGRAPRIGA
jgi:flavin reductase (DIM6/NTAB) family NADH-FMN oxidoreductase RutF